MVKKRGRGIKKSKSFLKGKDFFISTVVILIVLIIASTVIIVNIINSESDIQKQINPSDASDTIGDSQLLSTLSDVSLDSTSSDDSSSTSSENTSEELGDVSDVQENTTSSEEPENVTESAEENNDTNNSSEITFDCLSYCTEKVEVNLAMDWSATLVEEDCDIWAIDQGATAWLIADYQIDEEFAPGCCCGTDEEFESTDTDGGLDYFSKGTCTDVLGFATDYCKSDDQTLVEYRLVAGTNCQAVEAGCVLCADGACVDVLECSSMCEDIVGRAVSSDGFCVLYEGSPSGKDHACSAEGYTFVSDGDDGELCGSSAVCCCD